MLLLALDTATEKGSLALVAEDRVLMEYSLESPNAYLTCLMPGVAAILRNTGKEIADLTAVAVSTGPGNFTGLRIGLATAKTLAWSLRCPLVPVPTLEVLAAQVPFHPHPVGVVMDAKRGEVFWGLFRCPEDQPQVLEGPLRLPVGDLRPGCRPRCCSPVPASRFTTRSWLPAAPRRLSGPRRRCVCPGPRPWPGWPAAAWNRASSPTPPNWSPPTCVRRCDLPLREVTGRKPDYG